MTTGQVAGVSLADVGSLDHYIDRAAQIFGTSDRRVTATLWWYSTSSTLVATPLSCAARRRRIPSPALDSMTVGLDGGLPVSLDSSGAAADINDLAAGWRDSFGAIIAAITRSWPASERSLWAIASDSLANRSLDAFGSAGPAVAERVARAIGPVMPAPRFVTLDRAGRSRTFCRRNSCCLIDRAAHGSTCTSCPRREPTERLTLLTALV